MLHLPSRAARQDISICEPDRPSHWLGRLRGGARLGAALLLLGLPAGAATASVVVVTNPATPIASLTAEKTREIWLGKDPKLGEVELEIADQKDGRPARDEFYSKVTGKNPKQVRAFWAKVMFQEGSSPHRRLPDDDAVKTWIAEAPYRLSYINSSSVDRRVKVLLDLE